MRLIDHRGAKHHTSEAFNKKAIVGTVCLCALAFSLTYCACIVQGRIAVDKIDLLLLPILTGLMGLLGRTGTQAEQESQTTVNAGPQGQVDVTANTPDTGNGGGAE